ncbi:MAG: hypothetical protein K2H18_04400 [Muribaculaceae bacterium]|nr:hypothetical protein [Muribaculaceae bacterium]
MKHAIGLDNPSQSNKKPIAYRNLFVTEDDPEWNEIVEKGLAVKRADPFCKNDFVYQLTSEGIDYVSAILGKKIIVRQ